MSNECTTFQEMYDFFLSGITDDMFYEITMEETEQILEEILIAAVPKFEFPRCILDMDLTNKTFYTKLTIEEMTIIRSYMICEWISFQLASVELTRQKFSGSDFKFTSQANHLEKLKSLLEAYKSQGFTEQRLYCRREVNKAGNGYVSTFSQILEEPSC